MPPGRGVTDDGSFLAMSKLFRASNTAPRRTKGALSADLQHNGRGYVPCRASAEEETLDVCIHRIDPVSSKLDLALAPRF
jgi:hypothetical protein